MRPEGWITSTEFTGLYVGQVVDNSDPQHLGRVKVKVVGVHESDEGLPWAIPAYPVLGTSQFTVPPVGTLVWVLFINGDPLYPVYFAQMRKVTLIDEGKSESVFGFVVEDGGSKVEIVIDTDSKEVLIGGDSAYTIKVKGGTVQLGLNTFRKLLTEIAAQIYNGHTHQVIGVKSGTSVKTTSGPSQSIGSGGMTSRTEAE